MKTLGWFLTEIQADLEADKKGKRSTEYQMPHKPKPLCEREKPCFDKEEICHSFNTGYIEEWGGIAHTFLLDIY